NRLKARPQGACPRSLTEHLSPRLRAHAELAAEGAAEVGLITETMGQSNVGQRLIGGEHHFARSLYAQASNVQPWWNAKGLFEQVRKMTGTEIQQSRQVAGTDRFIDMLVDIFVQA